MMFGKLFGAAFGFMTGGPLGALMGAAVGHAIDQGAQKSAEAETSGDRERIQGVFTATAFQLMGHIAKADGRVSERQIAAARAVMDHLRLNAAQRRAAIDCFTEGKQSGFAVDAVIDAFQGACRSQPGWRQQLLELLLNTAYADGDPSPPTYARLVAIAEQLGMVHLQFEALHTLFRTQRWAQQSRQSGASGSGWAGQNGRESHRRRPTTAVNSLGEAYRVLGLPSDAGPDQVKLAYRRLIGKHHPDKLTAKGISPTELAQATEKTRQLTAAYERIREARGLT
jgi:DnaJ like chaperone protein